MNRDTRRARVVLAFLLLASFTLLTVDYRSNDHSPLRPLERAVANVVGPGERAVSAAVRPIGNGVHFGNESAKMTTLERENEQLRRRLEETQNDHHLAQQLQRLLGYAGYYTIKPARVVASGGDPDYDRTVTIDIGTADGVHADMGVVDGLGLVGKVIKANSSTSTVALIDNTTSSDTTGATGITVGVRVARTGDLGSVTGRADGRLDLTVVKQNASLRVGDTVVTLGSLNFLPYLPDIPVGRVVAIDNSPGQLAARAIVQPFANLDGLDLLGVVFPPPKRPARNALIPTATPSGSPAATPTGSASPPSHPATPRSTSPTGKP